MKDVTRTIVVISGVWLFAACGQGPDNPDYADLESASASDALNGVKNCLSVGRACKAEAATPADVDACQQQVRACFAGLIPDGGVRGGRVCDDAASGRDGSHDDDAGEPPRVTPDGGVPPSVVPDSGRRAALEACLTTLRDCLTGGTDPMTCGQDARTCIEQVLR
jgi:hypothetical protein